MRIIECPILLRDVPKDGGVGNGKAKYLDTLVESIDLGGPLSIKDPLYPNLPGTRCFVNDQGDLRSFVPGKGDYHLEAQDAEENLNRFLERNTGWNVNRNFGRKPA